MHEERVWLNQLSSADHIAALHDADCRELSTCRGPDCGVAAVQLRSADDGDGTHPPTADEVKRAISW